jgi:TRAP-type mannitol/chloroaromatic compound transport system permease large subunit
VTVPWVPLILVVLVLLGAPLFAVIATSAIVGFHGEGTDLSVVASDFFQLSETPVLVAIPLFTYAGFVLSAGDAPHRLVRLSQALLGWFPGGPRSSRWCRARCSRRSRGLRASRSLRSDRSSIRR